MENQFSVPSKAKLPSGPLTFNKAVPSSISTVLLFEAKFAIYGKENYDYSVVDGKVVLSPTSWEKGSDGKYGSKPNGGKYLRYMATLGNDTKAFDPYTQGDKDALASLTALNAWSNEMKEAKEAGKLRVVKEPADISWMSTPTKNDKTESLLADANTYVLRYCFNKITSIDAYKSQFNTKAWTDCLNEINAKLGK